MSQALLILIEPRVPPHPIIAFSSHMTSVASKVVLSKIPHPVLEHLNFRTQKDSLYLKQLYLPIMLDFERHLNPNSAF